MITPKLSERVQRALRLNNLFQQNRISETSRWGKISLTDLIKALEAESINLNEIELTFSDNVLNAIALPSGGVIGLEVDTEDKSLLNDNWFYNDIIDDCLEFEECGFEILEYRFMFGSGYRTFKCIDKTKQDLQEFIANFPPEIPYSITEVFVDHPHTLCTRYVLTSDGLYRTTLNFKDGTVI